MKDYLIKLLENKYRIMKIPHTYITYQFYKNQLKELKTNHIQYVNSNQIFYKIKNSKNLNLYIELLKNIKQNFIFASETHGINHNLRTSLFSYYLFSILNLSKKNTKLAIYAALYHDIGRINDSEDPCHGARSAQLLMHLNLDINYEELEILKLIITCHSLPDNEFYTLLKTSTIKNLHLCTLLYKILKDSDGLDRVRLPYPLVKIDLLRIKQSKQLLPFSYMLEYNFYRINTLNINNVKFKKLSRKKLFELENDYIFHGSPNLFGICTPHQASCGTKLKENQKFAVYGTSNLNYAICFALAKGSFDWSVNEKKGIYIAEIKNQKCFASNKKGYIYCFEKNNFKRTRKENIQYICNESILPKKIYQVRYKDYKDFFCFKPQFVSWISRL